MQENSKPLMREGTPEQKKSAQGMYPYNVISFIDTLYTVLEGGIKLLHPFMPFITEELWQRLPRRYEFIYQSNDSPGNQVPSIMIASYPVFENQLHDPVAEAQYDLVISTVKAARSLLDSYGIKEEAKSIIPI